MLDPTDHSGAFRGRDKLYEHLDTLIKNAQKSITIVTTAQGLKRKSDEFRSGLEKAMRRGVTVRFAANAHADDLKVLAKQLTGADVRQTDKSSRFCIVDSKELMLMLTDDSTVHESFDSGIWVSTPYFVKNFEQMFDRDWKEMKKL